MNVDILLVLLMCIHFSNNVLADHDVTATGCVRCNGSPMREVLIKLYDDDGKKRRLMGFGKTNTLGCFRVTGKGGDKDNGKPDPFVKIFYMYSGANGEMEVYKKAHKSAVHNDVVNVNFGVIAINDIHCWSYVRFYDAMKDFKDRTTLTLPYTKLIVKTDQTFGPAAGRHTVYIRKNYPIVQLTLRVAQHELAHTFRQTYDGDRKHFRADARRYMYGMVHTCATKSNLGFAFNEGWAEYWAGGCHGNYNSEIEYKIEGNVVKALRKLQGTCRATDKQMVEILKNNPRTIHSFAEYHVAFDKKHACHI